MHVQQSALVERYLHEKMAAVVGEEVEEAEVRIRELPSDPLVLMSRRAELNWRTVSHEDLKAEEPMLPLDQ